MFCALKGATRTPARCRSRQSPATTRLLPTSEPVPSTAIPLARCTETGDLPIVPPIPYRSWSIGELETAVDRKLGRRHHEPLGGSPAGQHIGRNDTRGGVVLIEDVVQHQESTEFPAKHRPFIDDPAVQHEIARQARL